MAINKQSGPKVEIVDEHRERIIQQLRALSKLMDGSIKLPGTPYTFGIDPLIGLVPVLGDTISIAISLWIVYQGHRLGLGKGKIARMLLNIVLDWAIGLVPILGDIFDFAFKANQRNLRLIGIEPDEIVT